MEALWGSPPTAIASLRSVSTLRCIPLVGRLLSGETLWWARLVPWAKLAQTLDVSGEIYLFELDLLTLAAGRAQHQGLARFPAVRRDIALDVPKAVATGAVLGGAKAAAGAQEDRSPL